MIIGHSEGGRTLKIQGYSGNVFDIRCGYRRMTVPRRDAHGQPTTVIFNLSQLLEDNEVPVGTTPDEVYAVIGILNMEMEPCAERSRAMFLLNNYLKGTKEQRCNQYLLEMGALYETRVGLLLYNVVGAGAFHFPAYYIREKEVATLVNALLDYPGVASTGTYIPNNWDKLVRCAGMYGSSKAHCAMIKLRKELHLDDRRVEAAFLIARYVETHRH